MQGPVDHAILRTHEAGTACHTGATFSSVNFTQGVLLHNNLGGLGPETLQPPVIRMAGAAEAEVRCMRARKKNPR